MGKRAAQAGLALAGLLGLPLVALATGQTHALTTGTAYVALGDSYSSAPGVDPYVSGTQCSRSANNYAHLTAADLGLALTDVTCAAASTRHLDETQHKADGSWVQGPQLDALTPDTALVTLGLGGNDGDYFRNMLFGWPFDHVAGAGLVHANVVASIHRIRAIAPGARVVLVGYPAIYPSQGWCEELGLTPEQVPAAYEQNRVLAEAMKAAAAEAGADFIEMFDRSAGHDICAADPWVQGKTGEWTVATPFHPRLAEQQAVRDALVALLGASTASATATAEPGPTPTAEPSPTGAPSASDEPSPTAEPAVATLSASAQPSTSPTTTSPTTTSPSPSPSGTAPPTPTVTWYARQGRTWVHHRVSVPRPTCAPAVCTVTHTWRVGNERVGTKPSLYLWSHWLRRYVSVVVVVRAEGFVVARTYRWPKPVRRP